MHHLRLAARTTLRYSVLAAFASTCVLAAPTLSRGAAARPPSVPLTFVQWNKSSPDAKELAVSATIDAEMVGWVEGFSAAQAEAERLFLNSSARTVNQLASLPLRHAPRFSKSASFYRDQIDNLYRSRTNRDKTVIALMFCLTDHPDPSCRTITATLQ